MDIMAIFRGEVAGSFPVALPETPRTLTNSATKRVPHGRCDEPIPSSDNCAIAQLSSATQEE